MTVDIIDDIQMRRMVGGVVLLNICMSFGMFGIVNGTYLQLGPIWRVVAAVCLYISIRKAMYGTVLDCTRYGCWCVGMFVLGFLVGGAEHSFVIDYISYSIIITFVWSCAFLIVTMFMRDWLGIAPASVLAPVLTGFLIPPNLLYLYMVLVLTAIHCFGVNRARYIDSNNFTRALTHIGAMFIVPLWGPIIILSGIDEPDIFMSNAKLMF